MFLDTAFHLPFHNLFFGHITECPEKPLISVLGMYLIVNQVNTSSSHYDRIPPGRSAPRTCGATSGCGDVRSIVATLFKPCEFIWLQKARSALVILCSQPLEGRQELKRRLHGRYAFTHLLDLFFLHISKQQCGAFDVVNLVWN